MKTIDSKCFSKILEQHSIWLNSNGKYGCRAVLNNLNFEKKILGGIDLKNSILNKVNFRFAYLSNVDLSESEINEVLFIYSNLSNANLSNTKLKCVNFFGADLTNVNFSGVINIEKHNQLNLLTE